MNSTVAPAASATRGSSRALAIVYWLVVGIPLAWGVYQTVQKSIPLFSVTSAKAGTAAARP